MCLTRLKEGVVQGSSSFLGGHRWTRPLVFLNFLCSLNDLELLIILSVQPPPHHAPTPVLRSQSGSTLLSYVVLGLNQGLKQSYICNHIVSPKE